MVNALHTTEKKNALSKPIVAVVGLGYIGLPLATELGKLFRTIGFDLSKEKIFNFKKNYDPTKSVSTEALKAATHLSLSVDPSNIAQADIIIVAVPTSVDETNVPDFTPLIDSSTTIGKHMKRGAIVVYESTVYPGATEEVCIPVLEKFSGMKWKIDFNVGYSPERINPGDKKHTLTKIVKIVSGDNNNTSDTLVELYEKIITAGVYRASSIKVAEAAKVIENTQRDLNIALVNELAIIFERLGIDTFEVLEAASTKWNFVPFRPGLVGGHCIGVDPYYLTHKAERIGYVPQIILAGRRINDGMPAYIARQTIKQMTNANIPIKDAKVNVLGLTFKEDCPDLRNSKVSELVYELTDFGCDVKVHDPIADQNEAEKEYGINLIPWEKMPQADAIVAAVSHSYYLKIPIKIITDKLKREGVFIDVKSIYDRNIISAAGFNFWRL